MGYALLVQVFDGVPLANGSREVRAVSATSTFSMAMQELSNYKGLNVGMNRPGFTGNCIQTGAAFW